MKTTGTVVIVATLVFSAVAAAIFLARDRQPHSPPARISASDSPAPLNSPPPTPSIKQDNHPAQPPPNLSAKQDAPNEKVSVAMSETVVKNLIANVRVAAAKGDDATRMILLNGLKKDAPTARRLLQSEISSATDPKAKTILEEVLNALSKER